MGPTVLGAALVQLSVVSVGVGLVAATTGALIIGKSSAATASHPLIRACVCGLMTGIGLLVILPETVEALVDTADWSVGNVMLVFLSSMVIMFAVDHCFLDHEHLPSHPAPAKAPVANAASFTTAATAPDMPPGKAATIPTAVEDVAAGAPNQGSLRTSLVDECAPCEPCESEDGSLRISVCASCESEEDELTQSSAEAKQAPPPPPPPPQQQQQQPLPLQPQPQQQPSVTAAPWHQLCNCEDCNLETDIKSLFPSFAGVASGRRRLGKTFRPSSSLLIHPSATPSDADAMELGAVAAVPNPARAESTDLGHAMPSASAVGHKPVSSAPFTPLPRAPSASSLALALKMGAWMLHAMIDGMLLSSASSLPALLVTALPVSICAIQDVAAFTLSMGKCGCSKRQLLAGVVLFSLSFPLGAIGTSVASVGMHAHIAVHVMRCAVSAIFVYMAVFELAPPHSHSRVVNGMYTVAFLAGAASAFSIELIEQLSSG